MIGKLGTLSDIDANLRRRGEHATSDITRVGRKIPVHAAPLPTETISQSHPDERDTGIVYIRSLLISSSGPLSKPSCVP